jgi:hypothetical protein
MEVRAPGCLQEPDCSPKELGKRALGGDNDACVTAALRHNPPVQRNEIAYIERQDSSVLRRRTRQLVLIGDASQVDLMRAYGIEPATAQRAGKKVRHIFVGV